MFQGLKLSLGTFRGSYFLEQDSFSLLRPSSWDLGLCGELLSTVKERADRSVILSTCSRQTYRGHGRQIYLQSDIRRLNRSATTHSFDLCEFTLKREDIFHIRIIAHDLGAFEPQKPVVNCARWFNGFSNKYSVRRFTIQATKMALKVLSTTNGQYH